MTHLTDADIVLFAKIPRSVLEDLVGLGSVLYMVVELANRVPPEYFGDTVALLELAEKLGLPGSVHQTLNHDGKGRVHGVKQASEWNRQRVPGKKAS